jgi:hypothetical protein
MRVRSYADCIEQDTNNNFIVFEVLKFIRLTLFGASICGAARGCGPRILMALQPRVCIHCASRLVGAAAAAMFNVAPRPVGRAYIFFFRTVLMRPAPV